MAKFHVRARTVDLLGRQQIANISTAISELFKNAHDAYATVAQIDYFRDEDLFILRDDGFGMTKDDFETRWLTLGTESKLKGSKLDALPAAPQGKKKRAVLGEKGIGRLAIAVVGRQVLVLTRAERNGTAQDHLTAAYINWALFELPGVDVDQIAVPVTTFKLPNLPNRNDVKKLVSQCWESVEAFEADVDQGSLAAIKREMESFDVSPADAATFLGTPNFEGDSTGTHFFIQPANEILKDDIDKRRADRKATRLEKNLIGFTNTISGTAPIDFETKFQDHIDSGMPEERLAEMNFFTADELKSADHHFTGRFDEFGQFEGNGSVYQTEPGPYSIAWNEGDGKKTLCGPFNFSLAVLQGSARDTLLPPEDFANLRKKMDRHGGLYIYRDGIRVQPYGDSDYDFLDIEQRRTFSAAYYYYSYRRIVGAVELSGDLNSNLQEKAGREGFQENKAYFQLISILTNFFLQSAADFFREEGRYARTWETQREELNRRAKIRDRRAKQARTRKNEFEGQLASFFDDVDSDEIRQQVGLQMTRFEDRLTKISDGTSSPERKANAFLRAGKEARDYVDSIRETYAVQKPRSVGLSKRLTNDWYAYQQSMAEIERDILLPALQKSEKMVARLADKHSLDLSVAAAIDKDFKDHLEGVKQTIGGSRNSALTTSKNIEQQARVTANACFRAVNQKLDESMVELERLKGAGHDNNMFQAKLRDLENDLASVLDAEQEKLDRLSRALNRISLHWSEDEDPDDLTEVLEEELEELRERRDTDLELAQIGMALNAVTHEFEKVVGGMRDCFRKLKPWATANPDMQALYDDMRATFDHLDGYLSLFAPMDRRLHRTELDIAGSNIIEFVEGLFQRQLSEHEIKLEATKAFRQHTIRGYPSSFFPVFVNLVDNAIFWLQRNVNEPRKITFDVVGEDVIVSDNGPGVPGRDVENIFLMGFSRKPGGRGMGLTLSRETLQKAGYELELSPSMDGSGATFRLKKKSED